MKKLYLVETTTKKPWEIGTGFHLIWAETQDEAKKNTEDQTHEKIMSIVDINKHMKDKSFFTIINSLEL